MDIRKQEEDEERDRNQTTQNTKKLNINIRVPLQSYALHNCVVSIRPKKMGGGGEDKKQANLLQLHLGLSN
jgi:hypothetical protein